MRCALIGPGQLGSDIARAFGGRCEVFDHSMVKVEDMPTLSPIRKLSPDVVINTAAFHRTVQCEEEPERAFRVNALGQRNVAILCKSIGAVCVYISTDYVFDGSKGEAYNEDDTPNPINVYGTSKLCGEFFTRALCPEHYIIRTASLFGVEGSRAKGGNFIDLIVRGLRAGEVIPVVDNVLMSPTYTLHAARAIYALLKQRAPYGTYHVVNDGGTSWYGLAKEVEGLISGAKGRVSRASSMANEGVRRPLDSRLAIKKLREVGISMPTWKEGVKEYLYAKGYI